MCLHVITNLLFTFIGYFFIPCITVVYDHFDLHSTASSDVDGG